jgi:DNA mismatch repair protein MSH3
VRSELETRLTHLQPSELILPKALSKATEKVLKHMVASSRSSTAVRVERIKDVPVYNKAFDSLTAFYKSETPIEIDLTGDDDSMSPPTAEDDSRPADPLGLAAGLPGRFKCSLPGLTHQTRTSCLLLSTFPSRWSWLLP